MLENDETYCRIACLLYNLTVKRFNLDDGNLFQIIERMKLTNYDYNPLAQKVKDNNWDLQSAMFQKISSKDILDFPILQLDDLEYSFHWKVSAFTSNLLFK